MVKKRTTTEIAETGRSNLLKADAGMLLHELRQLIEEARGRVARQVNNELVMLNWHIGNRIRQETLKDRAEYGKQVVEGISIELTKEYGRGYSRTILFDMVHFADVFSD